VTRTKPPATAASALSVLPPRRCERTTSDIPLQLTGTKVSPAVTDRERLSWELHYQGKDLPLKIALKKFIVSFILVSLSLIDKRVFISYQLSVFRSNIDTFDTTVHRRLLIIREITSDMYRVIHCGLLSLVLCTIVTSARRVTGNMIITRMV